MATRNRIWAVAALLMMVTGFTACLKTENTTPSRPVAAFSVIQGISTTSKLDFYDNSSKKADSISVGFAGYNHQAYGGTHIFDLKRYATSTTVVSTPAANYDSLTYYTLVAYGDSITPIFRAIKDDFSTASTSKLNIRFFHLGATIGNVDLYLNSTKVDSNVVYAGNAGLKQTFVALSNVSSATSITVKKAGTSEVVATNTSSSLNLTSGNIYTIYLTGDEATTTGALVPKVSYIPSYY